MGGYARLKVRLLKPNSVAKKWLRTRLPTGTSVELAYLDARSPIFCVVRKDGVLYYDTMHVACQSNQWYVHLGKGFRYEVTSTLRNIRLQRNCNFFGVIGELEPMPRPTVGDCIRSDNYYPGKALFWVDPDGGACSGMVTLIENKGGCVWRVSTGPGSETEVYSWELENRSVYDV